MTRKLIRWLGLVTGTALFFSCANLHCEERPEILTVNDQAVQCLANVLKTAPNAVSVKPADDWTYTVFPYKVIAKGVKYTFRKPDGTTQTVGVYLGVEFGTHFAPGELRYVPGGGTIVPANNGRYELELRPPFPRDWYPPAKEVFEPPNGVRYVRQDSKDHPLYGLWDTLALQCRVDNLELNGPVT